MSDPTQTPNNAATPTQPTGPQMLGEATPEELQCLTGLKQQADQIVHQIGVAEVQKMRLYGQLNQIERGTNQVVQGIGERLGLPQGMPWSVTADGKVVQMGGVPMQMKPTLVPEPSADEEGETAPAKEWEAGV